MLYNRFEFGHTTEQRGSKSQTALLHTFQKLFPETTVLSNIRISPKTFQQDMNNLKYYEFDVSCICVLH
jgi:hypothetical protein